MTLLKEDMDYFSRGNKENLKFINRLNFKPQDFKRLKVLDVGCGHGSLCVFVANNGAKNVVGLDIDKKRINFANENLNENFKNLCNKVKFYSTSINNLEEYDFDLIMSKDTLEHIIDLEYVMSEMVKRLIPGGRMLLGFGPLYNSPYGDHKRTESVLPWGHLIRNERNIISSLNRKNPEINSIYDLGLNKFSLNQYENLIFNCGMEVEFFGVNVSKNPISKLFTCISKIPSLKEYFSHNIYCTIKKPKV